MSWPRLPRLNPCLPCAIAAGNPDRRQVAMGMKEEREHDDVTGGDPRLTRKIVDAHLRETPDYYSKLKSCGLNPAVSIAQQQLFGAALALKRGEVAAKDVTPPARHLAATLSEKKLREFAGTKHEGLPARVESNPRGKGPWVVWHKKGCAKVRNGRDDEKRLLAAGYKRVWSAKTHQEADDVADEQFGGRLNPKLLVLNPYEYNFVTKVEGILKRKLTEAEKAQLMKARKEYRTFHGRDPDSLVPVEVPKGTPTFVNLVGDVDRIDYTVKADSDRRGKWTHKAGDHGRTSKETKPALLVSVPGEKAPPVFAQRKGSEMYFKPTHGIMG